ncbi:MAG: GNAT family N-acetyltransferase [Chloroflexi bacterium]|nr:GNAT family N-acetyltransferase [Chloroflexota bacterium]
MPGIPTLNTNRLILRPFNIEDAARVKELAGEWAIAETTGNIPHPYEEGIAETWISTHEATFESDQGVTFAVTRQFDGLLIGAIGLDINRTHHYAELGYWIGKPYWNQGYCTESSREVISFGFNKLKLNRIQACHMTKNPASARVMLKIGMHQEGILRKALYRFGIYNDYAIFSILLEEYKTQ